MAANSQRIAGTAYVKIDSDQYPLGGSWSTKVGQITRETVNGLSGVEGYTETYEAPMVEGEFVYKADVSLEDIENVTDATITTELANGKVHVLKNAWCTTSPTYDATTGMASVRFEGLEGFEV